MFGLMARGFSTVNYSIVPHNPGAYNTYPGICNDLTANPVGTVTATHSTFS